MMMKKYTKNNNNIKIVHDYHERTNHSFKRFAKSLGHLDWNCQPNPYRSFKNTKSIELPIPKNTNSCAYEDLYIPIHLMKQNAQPLSLESISQLFYYSLSLSATKKYKTSQWSLRVNPSSGNLHEEESYLVIGPTEGICSKPSIFHYNPQNHSLELRCELNKFESLSSQLPKDSILIGLTSIHWRESWKYGERAFRYSQLDMGHAIACIQYSAKLLKWRSLVLYKVEDDALANFLGLNREEDFPYKEETETPEMLILIYPEPTSLENFEIPGYISSDILLNLAKNGTWSGIANKLSSYYYEWEIIDIIARATKQTITEDSKIVVDHKYLTSITKHPKAPRNVTAQQIIRQRRSAVDFDGITSITKDVFYNILTKLIPNECPAIWQPFYTFLTNESKMNPRILLGLFVHRVTGIAPGLYVLIRDASQVEKIKSHIEGDVEFTKPEGCPEYLPLYRLKSGNAQMMAKQVSCVQDIASDSAFAVAMISFYKETLEKYGPHSYKEMYWECGYIGQILYLEAEAHGVRGTGIGCFFDYETKSCFEIDDNFRVLYNFTVGGPIVDLRLQNIEPYSE